MYADIRGISETDRKNGETTQSESQSAYRPDTHSYARTLVPFVREILMRRDGHERHKISGTRPNATRDVANFLSSNSLRRRRGECHAANRARDSPENA